MHLEYSQRTGRLKLYDRRNLLKSELGYAGRGEGLNNPSAEGIRSTGPLPRGTYTVGSPVRHPRLGPLAFPLTQRCGETFGRSGFYIHGDNRRGDRSASSGCIVVGPAMRAAIAEYGPTLLIVDR